MFKIEEIEKWPTANSGCSREAADFVVGCLSILIILLLTALDDEESQM